MTIYEISGADSSNRRQRRKSGRPRYEVWQDLHDTVTYLQNRSMMEIKTTCASAFSSTRKTREGSVHPDFPEPEVCWVKAAIPYKGRKKENLYLLMRDTIHRAWLYRLETEGKNKPGSRPYCSGFFGPKSLQQKISIDAPSRSIDISNLSPAIAFMAIHENIALAKTRRHLLTDYGFVLMLIGPAKPLYEPFPGRICSTLIPVLTVKGCLYIESFLPPIAPNLGSFNVGDKAAPKEPVQIRFGPYKQILRALNRLSGQWHKLMGLRSLSWAILLAATLYGPYFRPLELSYEPRPGLSKLQDTLSFESV